MIEKSKIRRIHHQKENWENELPALNFRSKQKTYLPTEVLLPNVNISSSLVLPGVLKNRNQSPELLPFPLKRFFNRKKTIADNAY